MQSKITRWPLRVRFYNSHKAFTRAQADCNRLLHNNAIRGCDSKKLVFGPLNRKTRIHHQSTTKQIGVIRASSATSSLTSGQQTTERSLFIFGFGYLALGLANLLQRHGWTIYGTCRSSDRQRVLEAKGFKTFIFDTDHVTLGLGSQGLGVLRTATHVLVSISPASSDDVCPVSWILGREFKHVRKSLSWVGFLSTTSIYGDHDGDWVTEGSQALAGEGAGYVRRQAEISWLQLQAATGFPVHIFRLAGIYGPGRNAIEAVRQGSQSSRSGKRFTSRCHVYDICQALMASMAHPCPGSIYNVADDSPASREEVLAFVRQSLLKEAASDSGIKQTGESGGQSRRKAGEKRVSNAKMKAELGIQLKFPTFREGLTAIWEGDLVPFQ